MSRKEEIEIIRFRTGCKPERDTIVPTLENLQKEVGGYIEAVHFNYWIVLCDEEGKLKNKPVNVKIGDFVFEGDVIACEVEGSKLVSAGPLKDLLRNAKECSIGYDPVEYDPLGRKKRYTYEKI